ncbi:MAG: hypothetical protein KAV87_35345 [Desulfobacteraceae bacterium]|nr:hypothetical protein [Desulfobacteraceae bacterium]
MIALGFSYFKHDSAKLKEGKIMIKKMLIVFLGVMFIMPIAYPAFSGETPSVEMLQGSGNTIDIYYKNAEDLGAFEIELTFPANEFKVIDIQEGELLKSSQRTFSWLGPKFDPEGKVTFGFFSLGNTEGIYGNGVLAIIEYEGDLSLIAIKSIKATDTKGNVILRSN